jgi:hypothetical protein
MMDPKKAAPAGSVNPLTREATPGPRDFVVRDDGGNAVGFYRTLGRDARGNGVYAAYDDGGHYVGRFPTPQAAMRGIWRRRP